jgi:hypothetical protein
MMTNANESDLNELPTSYFLGQELNWEAERRPITLFVELPFWLMTPNGVLNVDVNGHSFKVLIADNFGQAHVIEVVDSWEHCVYIGPNPHELPADVRKQLEQEPVPIISRKSKTVLRVHSECNEDVIEAAENEGPRQSMALLYLQAFCEAHLEIVNELIRNYRLLTYDI